MESEGIPVGTDERDCCAVSQEEAGHLPAPELVDLFGMLEKTYNWCCLLQVEILRVLGFAWRVLSGSVNAGRSAQRITGVAAELVPGTEGHPELRLSFPVSPVPFNRWFRVDPSRPWTVQLEVETRQMWRELVEAALGDLCCLDVFPIAQASVWFTFRRRRRVDADAFDYTVKYVLDALVEVGVLSGDSWDRVEYSVRVVPSEVDSVEVLVRPR